MNFISIWALFSIIFLSRLARLAYHLAANSSILIANKLQFNRLRQDVPSSVIARRRYTSRQASHTRTWDPPKAGSSHCRWNTCSKSLDPSMKIVALLLLVRSIRPCSIKFWFLVDIGNKYAQSRAYSGAAPRTRSLANNHVYWNKCR